MDARRFTRLVAAVLTLTLIAAGPSALAADAERDYVAASTPVDCPGVQLDVAFPLAPGAACFAVGSAQKALVTLNDAAPWQVSGSLEFYDLALSPVGDATVFCHQAGVSVPPDAAYLQVRVHGVLDDASACPTDSGGPATTGTIEVSFSE